VRAAKFHISTGFVGTALICHALTDNNQTQLACRMLLEKYCPSWFYPITDEGDEDLAVMGWHLAGRAGQRSRHDEVQSLRARCSDKLAPQQRCWDWHEGWLEDSKGGS
jgi:hypothetical protein